VAGASHVDPEWSWRDQRRRR